MADAIHPTNHTWERLLNRPILGTSHQTLGDVTGSSSESMQDEATVSDAPEEPTKRTKEERRELRRKTRKARRRAGHESNQNDGARPGRRGGRSGRGMRR